MVASPLGIQDPAAPIAGSSSGRKPRPLRHRQALLMFTIAACALVVIYTQFAGSKTITTLGAHERLRLATTAGATSGAHIHQPRKPLRIAAFTKAWSAHSFGGLGKHADHLYRSLAMHGHTVHVFTSAIRPVRVTDIEVGMTLCMSCIRAYHIMLAVL